MLAQARLLENLRCEILQRGEPSARRVGCEGIVHAEHSYDLQTKLEHTTVTAAMCCRFPITSSKGPVPWSTPQEHGKAENLPCSPCLF